MPSSSRSTDLYNVSKNDKSRRPTTTPSSVRSGRNSGRLSNSTWSPEAVWNGALNSRPSDGSSRYRWISDATRGVTSIADARPGVAASKVPSAATSAMPVIGAMPPIRCAISSPVVSHAPARPAGVRRCPAMSASSMSIISTARPVCSASTVASRACSARVSSMIAARCPTNCCAIAPATSTSTSTAMTRSVWLTLMVRRCSVLVRKGNMLLRWLEPCRQRTDHPLLRKFLPRRYPVAPAQPPPIRPFTAN